MKTITFRGLKIKIENEAGSVRSGTDRVTGKKWSTKMPYDYGELVGTHGVDGDPVDVFIGPDKSAPFVYIVHQLNQHSGEWDEDKCFLGFDDAMDAKAAYYKAYDNPDLFYGEIETIPFRRFRECLKLNDGSSLIHAQMDVNKGDPVTVDGMRGRGVVVDVDGDDVVIRYRSGLYIKRNKMFVHNLGDNMYKSRYVSAGGPGSGRRPNGTSETRKNEAMKEYKRTYKLAKQLGQNEKEAHEAAVDAFITKFKSLQAYGTPGHSGRRPSTAKGLNKWKSDKEEHRSARVNPKQQSMFGPGHMREIQKKVKEGKLAAAEVIDSPELHVVSRPTGPSKRIKKVGTNYCVVSSGTDRNFGCYPSREAAQAVIEGKSFITPDLPANMFAKGEKLKAFGDMGEPMAGSMGHAHIEPELWFHPPSEKRPRRIPVDEPTEKDDRFLDVTKRKQAKKDKMARLKRSTPGGLPALIPAHTTLVAPHTASYLPGMFSSAIKVARTKDKRMRVSFDRQGCI